MIIVAYISCPNISFNRSWIIYLHTPSYDHIIVKSSHPWISVHVQCHCMMRPLKRTYIFDASWWKILWGLRSMYVIFHDRIQNSVCVIPEFGYESTIKANQYTFMQIVIILCCFIHTISYMHSSSIWQSKLFIQSKFNSTIIFGPTAFTRWWLVKVWGKFVIYLKSMYYVIWPNARQTFILNFSRNMFLFCFVCLFFVLFVGFCLFVFNSS